MYICQGNGRMSVLGKPDMSNIRTTGGYNNGEY